jgi:lantibiotic modifying enzyme
MTPPAPFLQSAVGIGRSLCRAAIWDTAGRLCNWVGRSSAEITQAGGPVTPTSAALGPDLYGGSPGVAWFLAQLGAGTGEPEFYRTALAAAARSLRHLERLAPEAFSPVSYYSGVVGTAYALDRVAALTGEPGLGEQVDALIARAAAAGLSAPHTLDVIGGNAGAIPALLALSRDGRRTAARDLAEQLGEELLRTALRHGSVWTWDSEKAAGPAIGRVPLTGFAHGNAGLGLALFELYAVTGRTDYLEGGRGAFAYEDSLFDARAGNWPDLRPRGPGEVPGTAPHFTTAWCHGAPGIALARARAAVLDPDFRDTHAATARAALATTGAALAAVLGLPRHDATLCHGACGLSEVTWTAGRWLGDETFAEQARAAGRALGEKYGGGESWPSGVATSGPNPSLMLGTAGIGLHFLRLHDPDGVGPILIITD